MINEKHTYEPSLYQCVKNDISDFANERILFNTNKRGRIWNNESKMEFINYVKTYGLEKASIKYNTKTNTKQYYSRFCKSLNIINSALATNVFYKRNILKSIPLSHVSDL